MNGRNVAVTEEDPLGAVLALEDTTDPVASAPAYADALRRLADRLRGPAGGEVQTTLTTWLLDALRLAPPAGEWASWQEARWDAAVDMAADPLELADFLQRTAERVVAQPPKRLHLLSMLRAKVVWRARDKMRRQQARVARRGDDGLGLAGAVDPQSRCVARMVVARVNEELTDAPEVQSALGVMLAGGSVTDAARESGLSRQAIYRALARIRAWVEGAA